MVWLNDSVLVQCWDMAQTLEYVISSQLKQLRIYCTGSRLLYQFSSKSFRYNTEPMIVLSSIKSRLHEICFISTSGTSVDIEHYP